VARALITLGTASGTTGQIWHLPVAEARTSRQVIETVYELAGHKPKIMAAPAKSRVSGTKSTARRSATRTKGAEAACRSPRPLAG
jgi:hypothetical protein